MTPDLLPAEAARLAAENARLRERVEALARECRAWRHWWGEDETPFQVVTDAWDATDRLRALEGP